MTPKPSDEALRSPLVAAAALVLWRRIDTIELHNCPPDHTRRLHSLLYAHLGPRLATYARQFLTVAPAEPGADDVTAAGAALRELAAAVVNFRLHEILVLAIDCGPEAQDLVIATRYQDAPDQVLGWPTPFITRHEKEALRADVAA